MMNQVPVTGFEHLSKNFIIHVFNDLFLLLNVILLTYRLHLNDCTRIEAEMKLKSVKKGEGIRVNCISSNNTLQQYNSF